MQRQTWNALVDGLCLVFMALLASTGLVLRWVLPPGSGRLVGEGGGPGAALKPVTLLWGMTGHQWGNLHYWLAVTLMAALAAHLVLHWRWVLNTLRGCPGEESGLRAGLGLLGAALLLAAAAAPFFGRPLKVTRAELSAPSAATEEGAGKKAAPYTILGSMTLSETARQTGVPEAVFREKLKLPSSVAASATLGRLKREYGFEMSDVRNIAESYRKAPQRSGVKP